MHIPLDRINHYTKEAVTAFWKNRMTAAEKQGKRGEKDRGERAGVTAGKNMDGFIELVRIIALENNIPQDSIYTSRAAVTLPGYFRPTKQWDVLIRYKSETIAAIEFKSQVGPSFGNNFNNRAEEAVGSAHDFLTAYKEGALGNQVRPFLGWLTLVEDTETSNQPIRNPTFDAPLKLSSDFIDTSYLQRYDLLCQRLVRESLYTAASLVTSKRAGWETGEYGQLSEMTSIRYFAASLWGHLASAAARLG